MQGEKGRGVFCRASLDNPVYFRLKVIRFRIPNPGNLPA